MGSKAAVGLGKLLTQTIWFLVAGSEDNVIISSGLTVIIPVIGVGVVVQPKALPIRLIAYG